ncbi:MAG: hypothetical protein WD251_07220, partial [Saccharospirillum sp.]|uniref:hypothetical protein n=1 Tax=Saccharospirillum sp. TaxID=2033801 RepID=UPI0034A011E3
MVILLMAGIGLLVFGGIVLLRYPNKPGGKIAIGSLEVSSVGAGLPLIVLGVACILAYARTDLPDLRLPATSTEASTSTSISSCFDRYLSELPADRQTTLEVGASDRNVLSSTQTKTTPIALLFNENRNRLGAMVFNVFPTDDLFRIDTIIDANCQPIEQFSNASRGGDKNILQNWDTLQMTLNNSSYTLRLGYSEGEVEVNAF